MKDIFIEQLEILASNGLMIEAFKQLVNERIDKQKPEIEKTDKNDVLGEKFRAYEQSKQLLTEILQDIETFKTKKNNKSFNKAI